MLLYDSISRGAERHPDRPAIYFRDLTISYAALMAQVDRFADALLAKGIGPGDSVAALLPNCPQFTFSYYGSTKIGAVYTPVNPLLKPNELEYIWSDCDAKLIITLPMFLENAVAAVKAIGKDIPIICIGDRRTVPQSTQTWDEFVAQGANPKSEVRNPQSDDPAVCIYTSGTTGRPKGALLSHRNLTENCRQATEVLHIGAEDNFLCVLPLFHSFAGTVCQNLSLFAGARFTIMEQFHPARVAEAVAAYKVTLFAGVPAMYGALIQFIPEEAADFSKVRLCVSGGAPIPIAMMQAFEKKFKTIIIEGDGPTECSPVTCLNPPDGVRKPGSVGLAVPGCEMKIFDDDDRELPDEEVGEIVVRGPNVMLGYLNQPEATAEAMKSGWYHTGDLGKRDSDGYFYIVDRKKDMLLVGGFNVYPREIEEVLYTHPAVADAAVIGTPDELRGEEAMAVVVLKPDAKATDRELIAYCRERLANYKVPRKVVFRDALPRGGTGKILKRLLRKEMDME
jgi:long-chain acyl-CoA synthetase